LIWVADIGGAGPHVTELLGLYYLDALDPAAGALIDDHLPACAECRESADRIVETIASLALLSEQDRAEMVDNFGALNRSGPPSERFVQFFAPEPEPVTGKKAEVAPPVSDSAVPRARPDEEPPVADDAPRQARRGTLAPAQSKDASADVAPVAAQQPRSATSPQARPQVQRQPQARPNPQVRPNPQARVRAAEPVIEPVAVPAPPRRSDPSGPSRGRSSKARNRRRAAVARLSGLLVLVVAVGGLALGALVRLKRDTGGSVVIPVVTVAATAADRSTGASLSVFLVQGENGVSVRATVGGLKSGIGYRLYAVASDGHALPVENWVSDGKVQDINAEVQMPLSSLVFFTVSRSGNHPVVSAYLAPDGKR
jgi:hypothetical protein